MLFRSGATLQMTPIATRTGCAEAPLTWSASGLPGGATFNTSSGDLSWTPDCHAFENGPSYGPITVTALAATGEQGTTTMTLTVLNSPGTVSVGALANRNVFENGHSAKPLIYKFSGVWGNHEGSYRRSQFRKC